MADGRDGPIYWMCPDPRAVLPLGLGQPGDMYDAKPMHISRRLAKLSRQGPYEITCSQAFERVIRACAEPRDSEADTWINDEIIAVYTQLHQLGYAQSIEAWRSTGEGQRELVGGVYGVTLGGAFFGESMFSRAPNGSKLCLAYLAARLVEWGYQLFDVQYVNPHLEQFAVQQWPREVYMQRLGVALTAHGRWGGIGLDEEGD